MFHEEEKFGFISNAIFCFVISSSQGRCQRERWKQSDSRFRCGAYAGRNTAHAAAVSILCQPRDKLRRTDLSNTCNNCASGLGCRNGTVVLFHFSGLSHFPVTRFRSCMLFPSFIFSMLFDSFHSISLFIVYYTLYITLYITFYITF